MHKPYSVKISKLQPAFWGEIKENNLKGITDTTVVLINGKVNNYNVSAENIELFFINKENNKTFNTVTDSNGDFKINIVSGVYKLQLKTYEFGNAPTLNFNDLNFKSGEIRELKIYTESSAETISIDTIFKSKKAYDDYFKQL